MRIRVHKFAERIEFLLISIFLLYSMWFQYGFFVIDSLLSILGLCMVAVFIVKNWILKFALFKDSNVLLAFVATSLLFGALFSDYRSIVFNLGLLIVKYLLPMIIIIDYVGYSEYKYRSFLRVLSLSGVLLSVFALQNGVIMDNNGITLEGLNANVLASYLTLAVFAILILFEKAKFAERVLLGLEFAVCAMATFNSASRRGALVLAALSLIYLYVFCRKANKSNRLQKFVLIVLAFTVVIYILSKFPVLMNNSTLLQRLLGGGDVSQSDLLRHKYQTVAFELFLDHPLWGGGLGFVSATVGMHSHSLYYELLACTGIIGTVLFIWFLLRSIYVLNKLIKRGKGRINGVRGLTTMAFIASILVSGIQVTYIYDSFFYLMVAAFLSTTNVLKEEMRQYENSILLSQF